MKTRFLLAALALAVSSTGACTLLLDGTQLVKPCIRAEDCDDGFVCEDGACLPGDAISPEEVDAGPPAESFDDASDNVSDAGLIEGGASGNPQGPADAGE